MKSLALLDGVPDNTVGNMRDILFGAHRSWTRKLDCCAACAQTGGAAPRHTFLYLGLLPQERQARGERSLAVSDSAAKDRESSAAAVDRISTSQIKTGRRLPRR